MNGLWLESGDLRYRTDLPVPEIPAGGARVKVHVAGICGTDLEMVSGYYPFRGILGHEFAGVIAECPSRPERVGERVVGEINASCGACSTCTAGRPRHCPHRTVLGIVDRHGAFADYLLLPEPNLITIPDEVPDQAAVFTEPLAAALEILEQIRIDPDARVLLIGAGRLGQMIARVICLKGCGLTVAARYESQRHSLRDLNIDLIEEARIPAACWDIVIEATGSPDGLTYALGAVRPAGTVVMKSTYKGLAEIDMSRVVVDEIRLVGSRCGPFRPALELLRQDRIQVRPLIETIRPLREGLEAFKEAGRPGAMKILLEIRQGSAR